MLEILTGFAVVAGAILAGFIIGRMNLLGEGASVVLGKLCFFVLNPFLLFTVLARADLHVLFSALLPASALTAVAMFAIFGTIARLWWKRSWTETVVGAFGAGYVNANNIGLPIATYVLGSAAFSAPVILLQLLIFSPIILAILDAASSGRTSFWRTLLRAFRNPMIIGSALGLIVAVSGITVPQLLLAPAELLAGGAVPVLLISFGMSLATQRVLTSTGNRRDILVATAFKLVLMPIAGYLIGRFLFGLTGDPLRAVTLLAALPSAQNVFNYAQRYGVGVLVARDVVFLTTLGCIPFLLAVALLVN